MDQRRVGATVALLALLALAGCGEPIQTEVVCAGCADAPDSVRGVTVEESVTHMYVGGAGDARVEARIAVSGDGVDRLRDERTQAAVLDDIVDAGTAERGGIDATRSAFERQDLTARMESDTFVVSYRVTDISQQRLGTTVVDGFFRADGEGREQEGNYDEGFELGTDRLVVHGPEGTRPVVAPPEADRSETTVTWTGSEIHHRSYIVFGQDGTTGRLAIALETVDWAGKPLLTLILGATLPLFGMAVAFSTYYPGRDTADWRPGQDPLFGAVYILLILVLAIMAYLVSSFFSIILGLGLLLGTLIVGGLVFLAKDQFGLPPLRRERLRDFVHPNGVAPGQLPGLPAILASLSVIGLLVVATTLVGIDYRPTFATPVAVASVLILVASFPVLGYLVTQPDRSAARAALVTAIAGTPWLGTFAAVIESGAEAVGGVVLILLIGSVGVVLCPLLFYLVLLRASR